MVNSKPQNSGMKFFEIVCYIAVLWRERWIPSCSYIRLWFVFYMCIIVSFGNIHNMKLIISWSLSNRMDPVIIGNIQSYSQCRVLRNWYQGIGWLWISVFQTGLIRKVLEAAGIEHCNGFPTPTKLEVSLGTDNNSSESKRYWYNSYASVIGIFFTWNQTQY